MADGQNWQQGGYGRPPAGAPGYGQGQGPVPGQHWGPPQPPAPQWQPRQQSGGGGRKAGLVVLIVVVLAGLGVGGYFLKDKLGGNDDDGTYSYGYQLTLPTTTGDFRIAGPAKPVTDFDRDRLNQVGLSDPKGTSATYYAGISPAEAANLDPSQLGSREVTTMGVFGAWGEVADPEKAVDALFQYGVEQAHGTNGIDLTLVGEPEPEQPHGIEDATMKCQYAEVTGIRVAICVWADDHTIGFVTLQRQNAQGPVELPLDVAADHVSALRIASMVKIDVSPAN